MPLLNAEYGGCLVSACASVCCHEHELSPCQGCSCHELSCQSLFFQPASLEDHAVLPGSGCCQPRPWYCCVDRFQEDPSVSPESQCCDVQKKTIAPNETTIMLGQQILKRVEFAEESQAKVGRLMGYPESIQTICYLEEDKAIRFQKFPCLEEDSIFQLWGSAFIQNNNLCLPQDSQNLCICICFGSPAANTNYRFEWNDNVTLLQVTKSLKVTKIWGNPNKPANNVLYKLECKFVRFLGSLKTKYL